jgi:tetratricopeptide (TPR) repeat protein
VRLFLMIRPLAIAVLGFATAAALAHRVHALPAMGEDSRAAELHLPAIVMQTASAGYGAVMADWYWLEAIQYFGTKGKEAERFHGLAPYLESAVDLDPEFDYVYQFAGEVLPFRDGATGLWYNTEAARRLLDRGMQSTSTRWRIPFLLAYVLYTFKGDYLEAGHELEKAAARPGAPSYLNGFAAKLLAQGGSAETAIEFAEEAIQRTIDERTHGELEERLRALYLQKDLADLNRAAEARLAAGQPLARLDDLIGYAGMTELPAEPFGGHFQIVGAKVVSSDDDKLLRLFVHAHDSLVEPHAD